MSDFASFLNTDKKNLWRYEKFFAPVEERFRLSSETDFTPLCENTDLANLLSVEKLYLKREDLAALGSHKSRSLAYQTSRLWQAGTREAVICSTGNAAICAARYCQLAGIKLTVFFSDKRPGLDAGKIEEIKKYSPELVLTAHPIPESTAFCQKHGLINLKPSSDDNSIVGLRSLGFELFEQLPGLSENDGFFLFVTSGSTVLGMSEAFDELITKGFLKSRPLIYVVQSGDCLAMAEAFDKREIEEDGVIGVLGIKNPPRAQAVIAAVKKTGGSGIIVSGREIEEANSILENHEIITSDESAAGLAGLQRFKEISKEPFKLKRAIVVLTGKRWGGVGSRL